MESRTLSIICPLWAMKSPLPAFARFSKKTRARGCRPVKMEETLRGAPLLAEVAVKRLGHLQGALAALRVHRGVADDDDPALGAGPPGHFQGPAERAVDRFGDVAAALRVQSLDEIDDPARRSGRSIGLSGNSWVR